MQNIFFLTIFIVYDINMFLISKAAWVRDFIIIFIFIILLLFFFLSYFLRLQISKDFSNFGSFYLTNKMNQYIWSSEKLSTWFCFFLNPNYFRLLFFKCWLHHYNLEVSSSSSFGYEVVFVRKCFILLSNTNPNLMRL